jgi:hypothetical protein
MRFLTAGIIVLALTTAAGADTYDGSYVGTSATFTGTTGTSGRSNACIQVAAPAPLTIANGHAVTQWTGAAMEGDVTPQGKLVMHSNANGRFEGQIDGSGALKGNYAGYCIYSLSWQRRR